MPRRYGRKRKFKRNARKKPWYSKYAGAASTAIKALKGVYQLRGLVNSELYKKDTQLTGGITDTGALLAISDVAQGDGVGARTGNSLYVRSVNWKGQCYRSTAGNASQVIRLGIIMDTQQIGDTTPSYTDVYSAANTYSHLNVSTVGRFKVLATKIINLSVTGNLSVNFEFNLPMRHHIRYNGTSSTDIQRGGLYLAYICDQASTNYPVLQSECRVSYHDN